MQTFLLVLGILLLVWGTICLGVACFSTYAFMQVKEEGLDRYRPHEREMILEKAKGLPYMLLMSGGIIVSGVVVLILRR